MHFISGFFQPGFLFLCIHRAEANGNTNSPLFCEKKNTKTKQQQKNPQRLERLEHSPKSEHQDFY